MYIAKTPQKLGQSYSSSATDYVAYLEKENEGLEQENQEHFLIRRKMEFPKKPKSKLKVSNSQLKSMKAVFTFFDKTRVIFHVFYLPSTFNILN